MNTTYFLNCAAGNIFNTKTSPALPKTYYIGLSTSAQRYWCKRAVHRCWLCSCEVEFPW